MRLPCNHTQSGIVFAAKANSLELHLYVSFFGYDKDQIASFKNIIISDQLFVD